MRKKNKLVYGFGVNDSDYEVQGKISGRRHICQFYRVWNSMIQRCYDPKYLAKRPTYMGMLEWIGNQPVKSYEPHHTKEEYLPMIFEAFPTAKSKYERLIAVAFQRKMLREEWNRKLPILDIITRTGLAGQKLGQVITELKETVNENIYHTTTEELFELVDQITVRIKNA